jgi:hypothetical protein
VIDEGESGSPLLLRATDLAAEERWAFDDQT